MTDLHDLDPTLRELDSKRARVRIFTESEDDAFFYNRLIGPRIRQYVEFVDYAYGGINEGQKGYHGAIISYRNAIKRQRQHNKREDLYRCLLDGHVSSIFGKTGLEIFDQVEPVFSLSCDTDARGTLFLNCNELENVCLLYSSAVTHLKHYLRVSNARAGAEVFFNSGQFGEAMERSLVYAAFNAASLRARGQRVIGFMPQNRHITDLEKPAADLEACARRIFRFRSKHYRSSTGSAPDPFKAEEDRRFRAYWKDIKKKFDEFSMTRVKDDPFHDQFLRLCDGKILMEWILPERSGTWLKQFLLEVVESEYAWRFQRALLNELTAGLESS
ncbi:hypothetical protein [Methylobacterium fujisawaense]|uniref:hypothetical protein n=1 Tax=Methylobacterium fujisawaense TaxID=107400 RepID=UPI002F351877